MITSRGLCAPTLLVAVMAAALTIGVPAEATGAPLASPPACQASTPGPADTFPGATVVADNFESGTLASWSVHTGGDGTADVESAPAPVYDGGCAARLRTSTSPGSLANASAAIPAGTGEVYADSWFNITAAGVSGATNSYFRFFAGSTRLVSVYRYASNGQFWLEVLDQAGTYTRLKLTSRPISLSAWHRIQAAVMPGGASTTIEVWLDDTRVFSSSGVDGPSTPITSVMLGSENNSQAGDVSIDDVIIKAAAATGQPCATQTVPTDNMPGQVLVADGFECGDLDNWVVHMTGDGLADAETSPVYDGTYAACLHISDVSPSMANVSKQLPAGTTEASADGWFDITGNGPDGNDEPYFRFFTGSTRFVDVYRYNSTGEMWLRVLQPDGTYKYTQLTKQVVPLGSWHRLQMLVIASGLTSTVQVWLDGTQVYDSATVDTVATTVSSIMLGAEHYPQPGDECFDDVILRTGS